MVSEMNNFMLLIIIIDNVKYFYYLYIIYIYICSLQKEAKKRGTLNTLLVSEGGERERRRRGSKCDGGMKERE